jgi:hypothetical protein
MSTLKTILLALIFGLALVGAAPDTAAAAPNKTVTYSVSSVPLVDDDGVTRNFHVSYYYVPARDGSPSRTTCTYSVRAADITNPAAPRDFYLGAVEGEHTAYGLAPAANGYAALDYCKSVFDQRTRRDPDPTPPSAP